MKQELFLPQFVKPVLISLKHLPHFEASSLVFVPLLQLLEIWVAGES